MSEKTRYYEILRVTENASREDLKQALINHFSRCGDPEEFKEFAQALRVLNDPEQRKIYDEFGEDAVKEGMGGGSKRMGQDVVIPLRVSLERLYTGISVVLPFARKIICSECKGTGETINDNPCKLCKGETVVEQKKDLKVQVEEGMQNGEELRFSSPEDLNPGDIVFIIQEQEHAKFRRSGDDLHVYHTLSLTEALCGFQFEFSRLDNTQFTIKSEPGEVVKPGQKKKINGEGMPMYRSPSSSMRGNLYIHFTVDFPDSLTADQRQAIEGVLPRTSSPKLTDMKHPKFQRSGDLYVGLTLSLTEALCGFQSELTHLDNKQVIIKSEPGEVVKPGLRMYVKPVLRGKLFIHFEVEFPDTLTPDEKEAIGNTFKTKQ